MKSKKVVFSIIMFFIMLLIFTPNVKADIELEPFHNITSLYIETTEVEPGERVYVDFYGISEEITELKVFLMGENSQYLSPIVVDLDTNPYFVMPEIANSQRFEMTLVEVTCDEHGKITYTTQGNESMPYMNCDERKYVTVKRPLELTNLAMASHYDTITKGENERIWLDVEIKGDGDVELVTMIVRNVEDYNMRALLSLEEDTLLNFVNIGTQTELADGTYYISDIYINPHREDYIRYSREESEDALPLDFYVEFKIDNNKAEIDGTESEDIVENTLELTNLAMASHYDTITKGENERIWLDVEIKGEGEVDLVTMIVRNTEDPTMRGLLNLEEDTMLNFANVASQKELVDGTYYISDLYINPNKEDYIHYSREESEDARSLDFYVEFKIANNEKPTEEGNDNDIDETNTQNVIDNNNNNTENIMDNNNTENIVDNTEDNNNVSDVEKNEPIKNSENNDEKFDENIIAILVVAFLIIISILMTIIIMSALKKK